MNGNKYPSKDPIEQLKQEMKLRGLVKKLSKVIFIISMKCLDLQVLDQEKSKPKILVIIGVFSCFW
jgi:hypothetical protein